MIIMNMLSNLDLRPRITMSLCYIPGHSDTQCLFLNFGLDVDIEFTDQPKLRINFASFFFFFFFFDWIVRWRDFLCN